MSTPCLTYVTSGDFPGLASKTMFVALFVAYHSYTREEHTLWSDDQCTVSAQACLRTRFHTVVTQVNVDDVMAFLDRSFDTAEDAVMHLGRVFKKPSEMNLPLRPGEDETPPVTKKERVVVLGTGWGGHAISKVRSCLIPLGKLYC